MKEETLSLIVSDEFKHGAQLTAEVSAGVVPTDLEGADDGLDDKCRTVFVPSNSMGPASARRSNDSPSRRSL
ncbi:MAG: hypothetical protein ACJAYU_005441 [Bradymonadia bacterium]|jgi:hypothetical protein